MCNVIILSNTGYSFYYRKLLNDDKSTVQNIKGLKKGASVPAIWADFITAAF